MDQKAAGMSPRGETREWVSPGRKFGGNMTRYPDGTQSFELHADCKLQLCKENVRRLVR